MITKEQYTKALKAQKYSPTTLYVYSNYYDLFQNYTENGEINEDSVNAYLASHNTITARSALKKILEYSEKPIKIAKIKGKIIKKIPEFMTKNQIETLISQTNLRSSLLFSLLFDTTKRISEVINMKVGDFDLPYNTIKGLGKGNKEYIDFYTNRTKQKIMAWIEHNNLQPTDKLLRIGVRNARRICYKETLRLLGKRFSPHKFRHSWVYYAKEQMEAAGGIDWKMIQQKLNHAKPAMTIEYYDPMPTKLVKKKYFELMK